MTVSAPARRPGRRGSGSRPSRERDLAALGGIVTTAAAARLRARKPRAYLWALSVAATVSGGLAIVSGIVDVMGGGNIAEPFLWPFGVLVGLAGLFGWRVRYCLGDPTTAHALGSAVVFFLGLISLSTVVYLITSPVGRLDDALFESVAGYSTTAMTSFTSPMLAEADQSVLLWRVGTQWIGGATALIFAVALVPFWGGDRELADPGSRHRQYRALAPTPVLAARRILELYSSITVIAVGVFVIAGLDVFEAVSHALSTVSTGGFSSSRFSTAAYDSPAVEWLTAALMALSGSSIAIIWWIIRGRLGVIWQAMEMRVYLGALAGASLVFSWWGRGSAEPSEAIRHGVFKAASTLSTTGHQVTDWTSWSNGTYALMLFLVGVGSMAGSAGGGFKWLRVIEAVQYFRRELQRQIHPNAVIAVKVGSRSVSERALERMHAQQTLVILVGGFGMFCVALFGGDLITAAAASISALSTFGPGLGDLGPFTLAGEALSRPARAALMPLMLAGRVSIYPLLVTAAIVSPALRRRTRAMRRSGIGAKRSARKS